MCEVIWGSCLLLSHPGLYANPSLNMCSFKLCCLVSSLVIILSWFLLKLSISWARLVEGLLRRPLRCLSLKMDCQYPLNLLLVQYLITPLTMFGGMPMADLGPISGYVEPCLSNWSAILFPSMHIYPCTVISWSLLYSARFSRDWWQSRTNLECIWKLSGALMTAWLSGRI